MTATTADLLSSGTGHDLLTAVCASPDDDGPRLVLADWLEENGDGERAEFIRLQIELTKPVHCEWIDVSRGLPCRDHNATVQPYRVVVTCPACTQRDRLCFRERELLWRHTPCFHGFSRVHPQERLTVADCKQCHSNQTNNLHASGGKFLHWGGLWLSEPFVDDSWPPLDKGWWWEWDRGFVDTVTLDTAAWLAHGPALVKVTPLRRVTISDLAPYGMEGFHWWFRRSDYLHRVHRDVLPDGLYKCLPGREVGSTYFDTSDAALAALSTAALTWARQPEESRR